MNDEDYYERRERRVASVAVYIICSWIGLAGGVLAYGLMRLVVG